MTSRFTRADAMDLNRDDLLAELDDARKALSDYSINIINVPLAGGIRELARRADAFMREAEKLRQEHAELLERVSEAARAYDSPVTDDFFAGVRVEAAHQVERWGVQHDAGKAPEDWFWLLGYLGGKALHAAKTGDREKALHHTISTAAALCNWHRQIVGDGRRMRPGIEPPPE